MKLPIKIAVLIATALIFPLVRSTKAEGIDCDFSNKLLCGWTQDQKDDFDWLFNCKYDNPNDCLVYIDSTSHRADAKSRLVSPNIDPANKDRCFSFDYHMFGERVNSLNVYLEKGDGQSQIWHRKHSRDNVWRRGYRTIKSQSDHATIVIEAVAAHRVNSTTTDGIIAVRNIQLVDGTCVPPKIRATDENCDFEENFCVWKSVDKQDLQPWKKTRSSDISFGDKPATDHTTRTDNGYFAYISSDKNNTSVRSSFSTGLFLGTSEPRCLQFSYYMQRGTQAEIEVDVVYEDKTYMLLGSQIGVEENEWMTAEIPILDRKNKNHWIQMFGSINDDPHAFVAIDDMNLLYRACESADLCGFEYGWCEWRNLISNDKDIAWMRSNGGESVVDVPDMPSLDFSKTDAGFFLLVDLSHAQPKQTATLSSKPLQACPICLTFEYFTSGENYDGKLEIFVKNWAGERIQATISGATNSWKKKSVHITGGCSYKFYEIYVRATAGHGSEFIAIDELSISDGVCKPDEHPDPQLTTDVPTSHTKSTQSVSTLSSTLQTLPTPRSTVSLPYTPILVQKNCANGTIDCGDGKCILAIYLCDGITDCTNNADEANCTMDCRDKSSSVFCQGFNAPQCIPIGHLCDGHIDCIDQADETDLVCGACPKTYCLTGRCFPVGNNRPPKCVCHDLEHEGRRCETLKSQEPRPLPSTPTSEKDYIMWIMIPMMSLLVVIIAILLVNLYCYRKYKWYHAAGLLGHKNRSLYHHKNSMTEMTTTNTSVEEMSDDVGLAEAPARRGVRDDAISMIHTPLTNYKLHSLYIGRVVVDDDGNIVAVSNA